MAAFLINILFLPMYLISLVHIITFVSNSRTQDRGYFIIPMRGNDVSIPCGAFFIYSVNLHKTFITLF
uniref:Putative secreted protein n=1 Tax=Panstrongylus lignarius TaxID=156445 RepID=A0A224XYG0_9HEMI